MIPQLLNLACMACRPQHCLWRAKGEQRAVLEQKGPAKPWAAAEYTRGMGRIKVLCLWTGVQPTHSLTRVCGVGFLA